MQDAGPDLTDYVAAVRDRVPVVWAACVAGLVLGTGAWALTSGGDTTTATSALTVVDVQPPIDAAFGVIDTTAANAAELRIAPLVIEINLDSFEDGVGAAVDPDQADDIEVEAIGTEVADHITLKVEAPDEKVATAAVENAEARIRQFRTSVLVARYAAVREAITSERDELSQLAQDIDASLAGAPQGTPQRAQLEAERASVRRDLLSAQRASLALAHVEADTTAGIVRSGQIETSSSSGGLALPVALAIGLLLGILGGLGVLILQRFLSRAVTSRSGLEQSGLACLAVVTDPATDPSLMAILDRAVDGSSTVALGTSGAFDAATAIGGPNLRTASSVADVATGDDVLVVVPYGADEDEVRALVHDLVGIGATPVGGVLTGVPARHLVRARSR